MICSLCLSRPCDDADSIGSRQGLCQDCWESACSAEWWEAVAAYQDILPVESLDVEGPQCSEAGESVDVAAGR